MARTHSRFLGMSPLEKANRLQGPPAARTPRPCLTCLAKEAQHTGGRCETISHPSEGRRRFRKILNVFSQRDPMPRMRTPLAKAEANGAVANNPSRYRNRKEPDTRPLGKPSRGLTKKQVEAWEAFKRESGWLAECDRSLVETACQLRVRVLARNATNDDMRLLVSILSRLGMTPVDRQRVLVIDNAGQKTAADEFLN